MALRIVVWNVQWARSTTSRGEEMRRQIERERPDMVCLTEGFAEMLPEGGHAIASDPDYGYPIRDGRRKVLLWSREPWREVDRVGSPALPGGRFVRGTTETSAGPLDVFGVCIPWREAHVRSGRKDREGWEDHVAYLRGLGQVLSSRGNGRRAVVIGDYNQRVPRHRTPIRVHEELLETFDDDWTICTAGDLSGAKGRAIDHVAHTDGLACKEVRVLPKVTGDGLRLSDHFGLVVHLS